MLRSSNKGRWAYCSLHEKWLNDPISSDAEILQIPHSHGLEARRESCRDPSFECNTLRSPDHQGHIYLVYCSWHTICFLLANVLWITGLNHRWSQKIKMPCITIFDYKTALFITRLSSIGDMVKEGRIANFVLNWPCSFAFNSSLACRNVTGEAFLVREMESVTCLEVLGDGHLHISSGVFRYLFMSCIEWN